MKKRESYVSNSSSTSFLVLYNDISDFDSLKVAIDEEGHLANEVLADDIAEYGDKNVQEFLQIDCYRIIYGYYNYHYLKTNNYFQNGEGSYGLYKDMQAVFEQFCKDVNLDIGRIQKPIDKWKNRIDSMRLKVPNEEFLDDYELHKDAVSMSRIAFEALKKGEWKHAFAVTYHEEDEIGWGMDDFLWEKEGYKLARPYTPDAKFGMRVLDNR